MNRKNRDILLIISGLILLALACNLTSAMVKTEEKVVPTLDPAEKQQLDSQLATQVAGALSGVPVTIELTESQLTSLINTQAAANQQDAQISGLQVILDNNQAQISGDIVASGVSGKVSITLSVGTDTQGKPSLAITNASLNGFSLPATMLSSLSDGINQGLQMQAGQGFTIQSMTIADHKLIISAIKQ